MATKRLVDVGYGAAWPTNNTQTGEQNNADRQ